MGQGEALINVTEGSAMSLQPSAESRNIHGARRSRIEGQLSGSEPSGRSLSYPARLPNLSAYLPRQRCSPRPVNHGATGLR